MRTRIDPRELMALSCQVDTLATRITVLEEVLQKNVLSTSEASKYLGVSRNQLYRLIRTCNLPFFKPGRRFMFERHNLDEWVRDNSRTYQSLKFL